MGYLQNYLKEEDSRDYCDGCDQLIDTEKDGDFVYDEKAEYWYCAKCTEKRNQDLVDFKINLKKRRTKWVYYLMEQTQKL